jgi:hypothetical protein
MFVNDQDKMRENIAKIGIWNEIDIECKLDEIKCKSGKNSSYQKSSFSSNQDEVWLFLNITELSIVDTLADGAAFN